MRIFPLIIFLLTLNTTFGQAFPFNITFSRVYIGQYDYQEHRTTSISLATDYHYVAVSFDGENAFSADFYNRGKKVDSLTLSVVQAEQNPLSASVEYKYVATTGEIIFMRYNRYGVPGILEVSIFSRELSGFIYINSVVNETITTRQGKP